MPHKQLTVTHPFRHTFTACVSFSPLPPPSSSPVSSLSLVSLRRVFGQRVEGQTSFAGFATMGLHKEAFEQGQFALRMADGIFEVQEAAVKANKLTATMNTR